MKKNVMNSTGWLESRTEIFWNEIAPCDHVLQVYENDEIFLDALAGYVGGGINAGDCCIVIATEYHLKALHERLTEHVVHVDTLIADNRYMPLNAEDILAKFMIDGWPDETLFMQTVQALIERARRDKRRIRAFGEMVAILWTRGLHEATLELEKLWNKFCEKEKCCLFCAYPRDGFRDGIHTVAHICGAHSKMITGSEMQLKQVFYRDIGQKMTG